MAHIERLLTVLREEFPDWEFSCERIMGLGKPAWTVRSQGKGAVVSAAILSNPSAVRVRIEKAFGLRKKRERTQEESVVAKSRHVAQLKRAFRNGIAAGKDTTMPWARPRTLNTIIAEERTLAIAQKWQRMGEFRR